MSIVPLGIHQVLRILQVCGSLSSTWPPSKKAGKRELLLRDFAWTFAFFNTLLTIIPLALRILYREDDILDLMKTSSEFTILFDLVVTLIVSRMERTNLQNLLETVEDFLHCASEQDKIVIRKYIDRYSGFSAFMAFTVASAVLSFAFAPAFSSAKLPTEGRYPFSIDPPIRRFILYVLQMLTVLQTACRLTVDFIVATFFWYSAAQFDILSVELQKVRSESHMKLCIKKHQKILAFIEETQPVIRHLILKTNVSVACIVICGTFPLIYNQPLVVIAQFLTVVLTNCQRLFFTTWPADDLSETSKRVAHSVYRIKWIGESTSLCSSVIIMIQRCQKPVEIRISGILPTLSLEYYSRFLKTISSYFMMMRTILEDN